MPTQIHIYTINRGALDAFAIEWRDRIKPLREKFGFHVSGGWKINETNQFVWFLSRDNSEDWETQNQAFYQSEERRFVAARSGAAYRAGGAVFCRQRLERKGNHGGCLYIP